MGTGPGERNLNVIGGLVCVPADHPGENPDCGGETCLIPVQTSRNPDPAGHSRRRICAVRVDRLVIIQHQLRDKNS